MTSPDAIEGLGRIHHVAVVVRDLDAALGFYRDTLGLPVELILPVPSDRVRIGFLPVGESKIELVEPTDETTGRGALPGLARGGVPPRLLRGPGPCRRPRSPRGAGRRAHRPCAAGRRRWSGRIHPSPERARRARGAGRGGGWARLGDRRLARWRCPVTDPFAGRAALGRPAGHRPPSGSATSAPCSARDPRWDAARGVVWWVDIKGRQLHATAPRWHATGSWTSRVRWAASCCVHPVASWPARRSASRPSTRMTAP